MEQRNVTARKNLRYNFMSIFIYICGIILIGRLFYLQIIKGEEYRERSNTRLTRETTLQAARGNIYDNKGNTLAGVKMGFRLELYNSKISTEDLNLAILNMITVLEENGDTYNDNFCVSVLPYEFSVSEEKMAKIKEENKIAEDATPEEVFLFFQNKYKLSEYSTQDSRKIMAIRYLIQVEGYSSTRPLVIATDISRESVQIFNEKSHSFAGLNIVTQPIRNYTQPTLACHVLGYIGRIDEEEYKVRKERGYTQNDYIGKAGLEYVFEDYLRGDDGIKQIDMAVDGTTSEEYIVEEAIAGNDIYLTIDANLQAVAEEALKLNIEKIRAGGFSKAYDAQAGALVVTNVKTGEILALVSYPDFEPELFIKGISTEKWNEYEKVRALFNRAVAGAYAPGSIFKMVPAVAALETGSIETTERILDRGVFPEGHNPKCWIYSDYGTTHGNINVSEAIKHSCNYFFYEASLRMGIDAIEKYAKFFSLGEKTGVELPLETSGTLASRTLYEKQGETWYLGDTLNAVIGQGKNNFSPIQMVKYISILTNGGKNVDMTLIKSIVRADGTEVPREEIDTFVNKKLGLEPEDREELQLKQENLTAILEGMRSVTTESGGTAYSFFQDFPMEIGGKTGSTQANNYTNAWFTGFAPFNDPEIAVVVFVENGGSGSYTSEVVKRIFEEYFLVNTDQIDETTEAVPVTEQYR